MTEYGYDSETTNDAMFDEDLAGSDQAKEQDEATQRRLAKVKSWWDYARSIHADNRAERLRDHDVYDGDQWREEDAEEVRERGQIPTVFNRVKTTIDWLTGSEKKSRIDFRVLPRTSEDAKGAETKTELLKYLSDVNKMPVERSMAFEDAVISGDGWLEVGVGTDPAQEPIFIDYVDWRDLWIDPLSVRHDIQDARFLFRRKRVDLDIACAMFPDFAGSLRLQARQASDWEEGAEFTDNDTDLEAQIEAKGGGSPYETRTDRGRVELVECWYRTPEEVAVFDTRRSEADLGTLAGKRYREEYEDHKTLVDSGHASVTNSIRMVVRCMIFSGNVVLQDMESPYEHGRFPFVPIWANRKKRDNTSYGVVRNLRDPQDDLNKRRSKALFILATNQVIADDDAVNDWEELADEVSRPDGIIRKKRGAELEIVNDRGLAREHVELMAQDAEYIESVGGVTDEQLGRETNATSGRAIRARQDQGSVVNSKLFDNLRVASQFIGEIILSLVEQYYTDQQVIRVTNSQHRADFVEINTPDPETGAILNDITASQADFIVDSAAWNASTRQATFETLMEMSTRMDPQIAISILDLVMDLSDLPGKEDLVARIRMVNGMEDPNADPNDPEAQAKAEQQARQEQAEAEFQAMAQRLELQKTESEVNKNNTDAEATRAGMRFDAEKLRIEKAKALHSFQVEKEAPNAGAKSKSSSPTKSKGKPQETKKGEHGIKSDNQRKGAS